MARVARKGRKNIAKKFVLLFVSLLFCLIVLLFGEALCRIFTDINLVGNSRDLFIKNAYGTSIGNAKNAEAVSFGTKVYTDENGFRVPQTTNKIDKNYKSAILILGDSVGFGCGIDEEKTFAGQLRVNLPSTRIYNSSVIGYNTFDYKNVIENFLPLHNEINKVYLLFCLNDISASSAKLIDKELNSSEEDIAWRETFVRSIKKIDFINTLNNFLRCRSTLYLLIKNLLTDPQSRYWAADSRLYLENNDQSFSKNMQQLVDIATILKRRNVSFTVIITPYAFQLRNDISTKNPQVKLGDFFKKRGINYIDSIVKFENLGIPYEEFFLPYDAMHLSEKGHNVIYNIIIETL